MKTAARLIANLVTIASLTLAPGSGGASASPTLGDYEKAARDEDPHRLEYLRSYISGAVDTHLHYAKRLRNLTHFSALCTGESKLTARELGAIFELKILALRRRYGDDILGMSIVEVVPMIVEQHYRCF